MLSCEEVSRLVSESLDRRLPIRQRLAIRIHFLFCKACRQFRRQLLFMRDALRRLPDDIENAAAYPALTPEARERIKSTLKLAKGDVTTDAM